MWTKWSLKLLSAGQERVGNSILCQYLLSRFKIERKLSSSISLLNRIFIIICSLFPLWRSFFLFLQKLHLLLQLQCNTKRPCPPSRKYVSFQNKISILRFYEWRILTPIWFLQLKLLWTVWSATQVSMNGPKVSTCNSGNRLETNYSRSNYGMHHKSSIRGQQRNEMKPGNKR